MISHLLNNDGLREWKTRIGWIEYPRISAFTIEHGTKLLAHSQPWWEVAARFYTPNQIGGFVFRSGVRFPAESPTTYTGDEDIGLQQGRERTRGHQELSSLRNDQQSLPSTLLAHSHQEPGEPETQYTELSGPLAGLYMLLPRDKKDLELPEGFTESFIRALQSPSHPTNTLHPSGSTLLPSDFSPLKAIPHHFLKIAMDPTVIQRIYYGDDTPPPGSIPTDPPSIPDQETGDPSLVDLQVNHDDGGNATTKDSNPSAPSWLRLKLHRKKEHHMSLGEISD